MWFHECPKAPASEHPFKVNQLTGLKHCLNASRRCFYAIFPLISDKSKTERSPLVRSRISGLFFPRLTCDHMYSRLNRDIFPQAVRTQLSLKPKPF